MAKRLIPKLSSGKSKSTYKPLQSQDYTENDSYNEDDIGDDENEKLDVNPKISKRKAFIFQCISGSIYFLYFLISFLILYVVWLSYETIECPHL